MKSFAPHDRPREKLDRHGSAVPWGQRAGCGHPWPRISPRECPRDCKPGAAFGGRCSWPDANDRMAPPPHIWCGTGEGGADSGRRGAGATNTVVHSVRPAGFRESRGGGGVSAAGSRIGTGGAVRRRDARHETPRDSDDGALRRGRLDSSLVHPREVFRAASECWAAAVVLFHNHPSGDPTPSADDVALTRRLIDAGVLMGIEVRDHLVLADSKYFSFKEAGRI